MLELTEKAKEQFAEYFKNREKQPVRVFLNEGGWGGPSLALALDEARDSDQLYSIEDFDYVVDKEFLKKAAPIKIDFNHVGFSISSNVKLEAGGGCSSCSSDGSCS